jgi:hypothetical protein
MRKEQTHDQWFSPPLLPAARRAYPGRVDSGYYRGGDVQFAQTSWSHQRWETSYVWAYSVVFLTVTILSVQQWKADAYLFFLAVLGYGLALSGYAARRFGQEARVGDTLAKQWVVVHIVGMIGSYVVLWTAFFVDNAHKIPGLNQLPPLTFWVLPSLIGLSFLVVSLSRLASRQGRRSHPMVAVIFQ